jgi:4-hydroxybenzoate polyprenyltransferase
MSFDIHRVRPAELYSHTRAGNPATSSATLEGGIGARSASAREKLRPAAVTGELPWQAWALGCAVALWVAGFDLFYSLFDLEHDRAQGLHSWAVRWGERGVFAGARIHHLGTIALLAVAGAGLDVGIAFWLGVAAVGALLLYEHSLVRPGDLRRLDAAFFTVNGLISVVFLGFVLVDVLLR